MWPSEPCHGLVHRVMLGPKLDSITSGVFSRCCDSVTPNLQTSLPARTGLAVPADASRLPADASRPPRSWRRPRWVRGGGTEPGRAGPQPCGDAAGAPRGGCAGGGAPSGPEAVPAKSGLHSPRDAVAGAREKRGIQGLRGGKVRTGTARKSRGRRATGLASPGVGAA